MKTFPKKLLDKLPSEFVDNVQTMSDEELNTRILQAEEQIYKIDDDLASNEKIKIAKEELKEMVSPYRETKKQEQTKITYVIWLKESRGREIGS